MCFAFTRKLAPPGPHRYNVTAELGELTNKSGVELQRPMEGSSTHIFDRAGARARQWMDGNVGLSLPPGLDQLAPVGIESQRVGYLAVSAIN